MFDLRRRSWSVTFSGNQGRSEDMESAHIDNRRLSQVVNQDAVLEQDEIVHLSTCEECLEMVRILVRQVVSRDADS